MKSYNKTKPMRFEEFAARNNWWGSEATALPRVENEHAWKVSLDEIKARNYNLDIKNPHVGEQISHDPDELLRHTRQQQDDRRLRNQLKDICTRRCTRGEA